MIDARNIYHVMSARSHVFTDEQLANLTAIVWLYRGEQKKFVELVARYQQRVDDWLACIPQRIQADTEAVDALAARLLNFAAGCQLAELNADQAEQNLILQAQLDTFKTELHAARADTTAQTALAAVLKDCGKARTAIAGANLATHKGQAKLQIKLDALTASLKAAAKALEARHKTSLKLLDTAEKTLRARQSKAFDAKAAREAKRALLAADNKKNEPPTVRDAALEALKQAVYFIHQVHWLHSRFPDGVFAPVAGLCKAVSIDEIAANDWSLTPGRYVGVAQADSEDEEDFAEKMREIHEELAELHAKAVRLAERITSNFEELME